MIGAISKYPIPTSKNTAKKLPKANIPAPISGQISPPKPAAALNMPKFFSLSNFCEYFRSKAYSPVVFAAYDAPMINDRKQHNAIKAPRSSIK